MKHLSKKTVFSLVLLVILAIQFPRMVHFAPAESSGIEKVNVFLKDVVGIDTEKYQIGGVTDITDNPKEYPGIVREGGEYTLTTAGSTLDILFQFHNQTLSACLMRVMEGSPIYLHPPSSNLLTSVDTFLQKFQQFADRGSLEDQRALLAKIKDLNSSTQTVGNLKLSINNMSDHINFHWTYCANGVDYIGFGMSYLRDGTFFSFVDDRGTYLIGGTEVNVSKESAISIALSAARNMSLPYAVIESPADETLITWSREPLTVYPCWDVTFYLNMTKMEGPSHVQVLIFADTGEVIDCYTLASGGGSPVFNVETSDNSTTTTSSSGNNTTAASALNPAVIVACAVVFVIIASAALTIVKKGKTKEPGNKT